MPIATIEWGWQRVLPPGDAPDAATPYLAAQGVRDGFARAASRRHEALTAERRLELLDRPRAAHAGIVQFQQKERAKQDATNPKNGFWRLPRLPSPGGGRLA